MKQFNFLGFVVIFSMFRFDDLWILASFRDKLIFNRFVKRPSYYWRKVKGAALYLQLWPVYFVVFSRDCDCVESERRYSFPNYFLAMKYLSEAAYHAEGKFSFWQVSRKEYLAHEDSCRDRIGEAFDDGRGTAVVI